MPGDSPSPLLRERESGAYDHSSLPANGEYRPSLRRPREGLETFLQSKWGHCSILLLVSLDVSCIFADFLLDLHICEHSHCGDGYISPALRKATGALEIVSLVFSTLFMVELVLTIWAFGFRSVDLSALCKRKVAAQWSTGSSNHGFTVSMLPSLWPASWLTFV